MECLLCIRAAKHLPDFYYLMHFYRNKFGSISNLIDNFYTIFLQILVFTFGKIGSFWGSNRDLESAQPRRKFILISKKIWCSPKICFSCWNWMGSLKWSFSTFRTEPCWRFDMCENIRQQELKQKNIETKNWLSKHSDAFTVIKYGVNVFFCNKTSFSIACWHATEKGGVWLERELVNI
jgi:hypothetical protein